MNKFNIKEINSRITKTNIKGKPYVMVKDRIAAFREVCPDGVIATEMLEKTADEVTFRATISDGDGNILAIAHANEMRTSSQVNRSSYVENCETSAIGRAIAAATGIGIEDSFASADEVQIAQQVQAEMGMLITDEDANKLKALLGDRLPKALAYYGVEDVHLLTNEQYADCVRRTAR